MYTNSLALFISLIQEIQVKNVLFVESDEKNISQELIML